MQQSRQDKIRDQIERLPIGESITLNLYPKELKRFKTEYSSFDFEVLSTRTGENYKIHLAKISL